MPSKRAWNRYEEYNNLFYKQTRMRVSLQRAKCTMSNKFCSHPPTLPSVLTISYNLKQNFDQNLWPFGDGIILCPLDTTYDGDA